MGYLDAQAGDGARTAFRRAEKQYKLYKKVSTSHKSQRRPEMPVADLSQVLDFDKMTDSSTASLHGVRMLEGRFGFDSPVYTLDNHPGFYFIQQAVRVEEQFHWIREALTSFPEPPNRTSHTAQYGPLFGLWSAVKSKSVLVQDHPVDVSAELVSEFVRCKADDGESPQPRVLESGGGADLFMKRWRFVDSETNVDKAAVSAESLLHRLRWATLGVQFDWSKRAYDVSLPYRKFPAALSELATKLAVPAMDGSRFSAEAAIVNFFGADDMLGGHIDDMEADWSKPIVSISLGCKAIFLLGGEDREDVPVAMFLRSGDTVLMAGPARRCFHGVPRIFSKCKGSDVPDFSTSNTADDSAILSYIQQSRININIRQVF